MEGQRQRSAGRRRRKHRPKPKHDGQRNVEPVLIVARRPDSPRVKTPSRNIAASARPKHFKPGPRDEVSGVQVSALGDQGSTELQGGALNPGSAEKPRRAARIVQPLAANQDDFEMTRQRLLRRLLTSEGRSAISAAADALLEQQIQVPEEQAVQLQLLEHTDERRAREAILVIAKLLERQEPIKRPILDRRLRRLEQEADEAETRESAAALRRTIRVA